MSDNPGSLAGALYGPTGPAESPQGPTGIDTGKASWRGESLESLPAAASVPNQSSKTEPRSLGESIYGNGTPPPTTPVSPTEAPPTFDRTSADPALLSEYDTMARELRLNSAGSDRLLALHAKALEASTAHQAGEWRKQTEAAFAPDELSDISRSFNEAIGQDSDAQEFRRLLSTTGLGNNVAVIRVISRLLGR